MTLLWFIPLVVGLAAAALASRRAVGHALDAADATQVSAGFVGITVVAIGTDLPEIANSIISALTGHGDLAVGDTAGSAFTQVTLVLAILCLVAEIRAERRVIAVLGLLTTAALVLTALMIDDGRFSRLEGAILVLAWVAVLPGLKRMSNDRAPTPGAEGQASRHVALALGWLAVVAVAATVVVQSFVILSEALGIPELLAGAIVLALGTSLPELIVDWTAIRRGAVGLALGDLFGSSLLDATLAVGSGPAVRATMVSGDAVTMCLIAALAVAAATLVVIRRPVHGRTSAIMLATVYLAASLGIVVATT